MNPVIGSSVRGASRPFWPSGTLADVTLVPQSAPVQLLLRTLGEHAARERRRRLSREADEARELADRIEVQLRALTVPELVVRDLPSQIPGGPPPNRIIGRPHHRLRGDSAGLSRSVTSRWPHNALRADLRASPGLPGRRLVPRRTGVLGAPGVPALPGRQLPSGVVCFAAGWLAGLTGRVRAHGSSAAWREWTAGLRSAAFRCTHARW